jgi:hopene-associated glycosyltransferase HpnB
VIVGIVASIALAVWAYLVLARGQFWRMHERDDTPGRTAGTWPRVVAVVPARDEAASIAANIGALLEQDYPGEFSVVLVDDQSRDATADFALAAARSLGKEAQLTIVRGASPPAGWTGKIWAQNQGISHVDAFEPEAIYLLLVDADIVLAPDTLHWLVAHALARGLTLTSLMAKLRCESVPERLLIPAFIFFFQMLYPFAWVNNPARRTAAAAGGCMLVKREALRAAGGIAAIKGELIDDCALGRALKRVGPIWLGLTRRATSIRPYPALRDVGRMVTRSAYAQLNYSPLMLAGTIIGMTLAYVAPVALALFADGPARLAGIACWAAMALAYQPILRFYGLSPIYGALLPLIAAIYLWFTCESALQHARGRGGMWKGRAQAGMSRAQ